MWISHTQAKKYETCEITSCATSHKRNKRKIQQILNSHVEIREKKKVEKKRSLTIKKKKITLYVVVLQM